MTKKEFIAISKEIKFFYTLLIVKKNISILLRNDFLNIIRTLLMPVTIDNNWRSPPPLLFIVHARASITYLCIKTIAG